MYYLKVWNIYSTFLGTFALRFSLSDETDFFSVILTSWIRYAHRWEQLFIKSSVVKWILMILWLWHGVIWERYRGWIEMVRLWRLNPSVLASPPVREVTRSRNLKVPATSSLFWMSGSVMSSVSSYVVVTGIPSSPLTSVFGITAQEFRYLKVQISINKQWGSFDWKLLVELSVQLVIGDNGGARSKIRN